MKIPRPKPPLPPRCRVMWIVQRSYALRNRLENPVDHDALQMVVTEGGVFKAIRAVPLPPPRYHCVPDDCNVAICGAWPYGDAEFRRGNKAAGQRGRRFPTKPKYWDWAPRAEVSCPYCLSVLRKALRPVLKRRPQPLPPRDELEYQPPEDLHYKAAIF